MQNQIIYETSTGFFKRAKCHNSQLRQTFAFMFATIFLLTTSPNTIFKHFDITRERARESERKKNEVILDYSMIIYLFVHKKMEQYYFILISITHTLTRVCERVLSVRFSFEQDVCLRQMLWASKLIKFFIFAVVSCLQNTQKYTYHFFFIITNKYTHNTWEL